MVLGSVSLKIPGRSWSYLAPLMGLRELGQYQRLRGPFVRRADTRELEKESSANVILFDRNGYTGEVFPESESVVPKKRGPTRVPRPRLQAALGAQIPKGIIQFNKKLVSLQNLEYGGVRLVFQDGTETTADLVIGGDGIRSVGSPYLLKNCLNISLGSEAIFVS